MLNETIFFAGERLILDAAGVIFWAEINTLIVADLHLEKGSYFTRRGYPLPVYDTRDTLQRLDELIMRYQAQKVVCLGDNLHDLSAIERMQANDYNYLCELVQRTEWLWLIGNHDPSFALHPLLRKFKSQNAQIINSLTLGHDFNPKAAYQIIGHFHPKISLRIHDHTIKGKCFIVDSQVIVMPAFGSYTGGLEINSPVFDSFIDKNSANYFVLKNNKIWKVPSALGS